MAQRFIKHISVFLFLITAGILFLMTAFDFFFKDGIFYNELESKIDALYRDDVDIIIAGDSRAQVQVIPAVLEKAIGKKVINIALPACDMATIYNAVIKKSIFGEKTKTLVMSASIFQINDNTIDTGYVSNACVFNLSLTEKISIFKMKSYRVFAVYTKSAVKILVRQIRRIFRRRAEIRYAGYNETKGFMPVNGHLKPEEIKKILLDEKKTSHSWYKGIKLNGIKWKMFREKLALLENRYKKIIIFHPPVSPFWAGHVKGSYIEKATVQFSEMLRREAGRRKNVVFIDAYQDRECPLTDNHFFDAQHLNHSGAMVFSKYLAEKCRKDCAQ